MQVVTPVVSATCPYTPAMFSQPLMHNEQSYWHREHPKHVKIRVLVGGQIDVSGYSSPQIKIQSGDGALSHPRPCKSACASLSPN